MTAGSTQAGARNVRPGRASLYLAVGYWLQVRHGFIIGDALSRVSAAQSVLFSRDPHLAAIGFIFTPLTAMVQIPFVALSPLWPPMASFAYSGTIMSAGFMAAAVVQILGMGTDRGLPRSYVLAITALFALNPMIVFYGANGMSEAPFIFFVTWAVRRLIMWMVDDDVHHLIVAGGIAMGLSYLTRYDAVGCIAAAGFVVATTTYLRARTAPRFRRALLDLLIVSGPGFAAFVGWAVASWLITGQAFAQFTSQYGNAAILVQSGQQTVGLVAGLSFALVCISLLGPALVPIGAWAVASRWRQRNWTVLVVPIAVFGAALAFQVASYAGGSTFPFLRFYIIVIPMTACLAMLAVPDGQFVPAKRRGRYAPPQAAAAPTRHGWPAYVPVVVAFAATIPIVAWGMSLPKYAPQEYALGAVLSPEPDSVDPRKVTEHRIAAIVLDRTRDRRVSRQSRPAGLLCHHRHRLRLRGGRRIPLAEDLRRAVRPGLQPIAERSCGPRRQVPARGPTHGPRGLRRAQPALPDPVRDGCRHRHPGPRDPQ